MNNDLFNRNSIEKFLDIIYECDRDYDEIVLYFLYLIYNQLLKLNNKIDMLGDKK